jgi:hypothetical protein
LDSTGKQKKKPGMPRADFIMGLILMVFGLAAIHQSVKLPTFKKDWGGFYAAPGFVPLILGLVIFAMSLAMFIRAVRSGGVQGVIPTRESFRNFLKAKPVHRWCLAMLYAWGFFFILGKVYFYLAAFLVLFAFMATFSEKKIYISLLISVVTSAAIYLVFTKIFLVPLP